MKVRLTKKAAETPNGVDLSRVRAGDVIDIPPREAGMLLLSEWASPLEEIEPASQRKPPTREDPNVIRTPTAAAADRPRGSVKRRA